MKTLDKFCVHPWSHLALNPDGTMWPCCHQRVTPAVLGNMETDDPIEVFTKGEVLSSIRKDMMENKWPDACHKCKYFEESGSKSPRMSANMNMRYTEEVYNSVPDITNADGTLKSHKIRYWDLRWSNLCNMACVMCSPAWSSMWTQEMKTLNKNYDTSSLPNFGKYENVPKVEKVKRLEFVDKNIDDVECIYFAGGEPLIMDEHYYILDKLVEKKMFHVRLKYNTNMMKLEHKGKSVLDYWKYWDNKNLQIGGSVDETGDRLEWIRYGSKWETIKQNIITLRDLNIMSQPSMAIGCYNIFRLPELLEELWEIYKNPNVKIAPWCNPILNKEFLPNVLPDDMKKKASKGIKRMVKSINDPGWGKQFNILLRELSKPHDPENAHRFLRKVAMIDLSRGTNVFEAIPEISIVNDMYNDLYTQTKEKANEYRKVEK